MPTCASCNSENPAGKKFCGECGAALGNQCPQCGGDNGVGNKFCGDCGAQLQGVTGLGVNGLRDRASPLPPAPVTHNPLPEGERRQLTVLFCDLVGSTALSQLLDAEDWRDVVGQYQKAARVAVERWGGHVAKNLGDGLLIYFGWPDAREDDAERAIRAGLAILDAMEPVNAKLSTGDVTRLAVRIGMHTGSAVIADGGEVFGETANIAARVQGAAEPDTVVVTAATQRLVPGIFVLEDRGPQALKGVRDRLVLYRVVQPSGGRSRLDVAAGHLTRFVGREVELATLVDRWERAADGEGQNVLITGEAGVGKSRLAYQLRERLATTPHTWLDCGASPYTEGTPFHPLVALVAQGLAFTTADTPAEKVEKIARGLRDLASAEHVALLADFLGLPPPTPFTLNPDVQRRKTMELLAQWNLALSTIQPLVLLVEDLHWCDASSLELLGRIIAQSATARVLFVATARPEFTAPWPARSNLTTLQLAPLTRRHAREMVTTLVGETLPAETLEALVARAGGVPLYVEELTKAVAEPGAPRGADAIPTTLAGSLMARLDRLSTAKEVAQRAAVLGREFGYPLLAAVAEMDEAELRQGLMRLVDAEIVFQRGEPPEATYTFKHALVQEAAYESLLKRTRKQLHAKVANVLAACFPERTAAEPEVIARHCESAGLLQEAVRYYQSAGERRASRSAHAEAIAHFRHALAVLAALPESEDRQTREIALQFALVSSLLEVRGFAHDEIESALQRARVLCEAVKDPIHLGWALDGLANVHLNRGQSERGIDLATQVLEIARENDHRALLWSGHLSLSLIEYGAGKFATSLERCRRALDAVDQAHHDPPMWSRGLDLRVSFRWVASHDLFPLGHADRALDQAKEAVAAARVLGQPFNLAMALSCEAQVHGWRGNVTAQNEVSEELIALCQAQGFPEKLRQAKALRSYARLGSGRPADFAAVWDGGSSFNAEYLALIATLHHRTGDSAGALTIVERALAISELIRASNWDAELYRLKGEITLLRADHSSGERARLSAECFRRAISIARAQEAKSFELRAATSLARLWRDQGKRAEARDLLAPVYGWFTEGFDTQDLIEAKALLEELG